MSFSESEAPAPMRLFAAVSLPAQIKQQLSKLTENLRTGAQFTGAFPAWVKIEGVHLTLVFFGNQPAERVDAIRQAMAEAAAKHSAFELSLARLDLFPNARNPRVISVGMQKGVEKLKELQGEFAAACRAKGFELEEREFRPHLTLARIKSSRGLAGLRDLVQNKSGFRTDPFDVDSITLYQSFLRKEGAQYQIVHREALS